MSRRLTYLIAALIAAVALWVWPTPYREYRYGQTTARVNRFTGTTELLYPQGWRRVR